MHIWCNLTLQLGPLSLWCKLQSGCRATQALQMLSNQKWCWEGWGSSRQGLDFKLLSMRNLPLCLLILAVLSCCVTRTALTCHKTFLWDGCSTKHFLPERWAAWADAIYRWGRCHLHDSFQISDCCIVTGLTWRLPWLYNVQWYHLSMMRMIFIICFFQISCSYHYGANKWR